MLPLNFSKDITNFQQRIFLWFVLPHWKFLLYTITPCFRDVLWTHLLLFSESFFVYPFWDGLIETAHFIENVGTLRIYNILMIIYFITFPNTFHSWFFTHHYWAQSQYFHFIVPTSNSVLKNNDYVFHNSITRLRLTCWITPTMRAT